MDITTEQDPPNSGQDVIETPKPSETEAETETEEAKPVETTTELTSETKTQDAAEEVSETKPEQDATPSPAEAAPEPVVVKVQPKATPSTAAATPVAKPSSAAATTSNNNDANDGSSSNDGSNAAVMKIVKSGKLSPQEAQAVKVLANNHGALKIKVDRLKGLLGRSAKAQREAKVDLEVTQKRLEQAQRDVKRLKERVDHISSRPTHMDLLNDFETNFDRALASVGQAGGEDTAAPVAQPTEFSSSESAVDTMLTQELEEARTRLTKLEALNSTLMQRAAHLDAGAKDRKKERDDTMQKMSHMELELRMSKMEADHAKRAMEEKAASLEEMQMEIDLVTKSSMKANVRAAQGQAVAKSSKTDRQHVVELEAQVQALKEWALASAESKRLALERVKILEKKLQIMHGVKANAGGEGGDANNATKSIYSRNGSLVVGAGLKGHLVVELKNHMNTGGRLLLKWKFDALPGDCTTTFNILKGKCATAKEQAGATYLIRDRVVTGGAAGELEGVFSEDQNECTLLWSNSKSWIRPRTVKYSLEVTS